MKRFHVQTGVSALLSMKANIVLRNANVALRSAPEKRAAKGLRGTGSVIRPAYPLFPWRPRISRSPR